MKAILLVLTGALLFWMPALTRRDLFFAVTLAPGFSGTPEGRKIRARYRVMIALATAACIALSWRWFLAAVAAQIVAASAALVWSHKAALRYAVEPSPIREAELRPRRELSRAMLLAALAPFGFLGAAGIELHRRWAELPARFPVHWNWAAQPNRWVRKTPGAVFGIWGMEVLLCGIMAALVFLMAYGTRRISPAAGEQRFRRITIWMLIASEYLVAWVALLPLGPDARPGYALTAVVLALTVLLLWLGQGGARQSPVPVEPAGDRTPDRCWKGGLFYYNPEDPAIMVEKRFGVGYTFNFARGAAWLFLAALVAAVLIPLLLVR